jgi:hypothetical protein
MSQQTVLELVISQLKEHITKSAHNQLGTNRTGDYRIGLVKAIDFCEQAKELEKERLKHAYDWGETNASDECNGDGATHENFEQYFEETYKSE